MTVPDDLVVQVCDLDGGGVDALVAADPVSGQRTLFLSPHQSFDNAVEKVSAVLGPRVHPDEVRQLVRAHLPAVQDERTLGDLVGDDGGQQLTWKGSPERWRRSTRGRRRAWRHRAGMGAVAAGLVGLMFAAGVTGAMFERGELTGTTTTDRFEAMAATIGVSCPSMRGPVETCTDRSGEVLAVETYTLDARTMSWVFHYGGQLVGVRYSGEEDLTPLWASGRGLRSVLPRMTVAGSYAVWGTDDTRVDEWAGALAEAEGARPEVLPSVAAPDGA